LTPAIASRLAASRLVSRGHPGTAGRARRRALLRASLAFALLTSSATAAADEAQAAAALKQRADAAMDALHYTEALDLYSKAYEATHNPAILYNMGRAHEAQRNYPAALEDLTSFQQRASAELLAKVPGLAKRIADVRAHVSTVSIETSVTGARVLLEKKDVGVTPLAPIMTNAGHATLELIADGYRPFRTELDLVGGTEVKVEARLLSKSTTGILAIRSPAGATVELDGRPAGTPRPRRALRPAGSVRNERVVVHLRRLDRQREREGFRRRGVRRPVCLPRAQRRQQARRARRAL
jgi:hypothetical protein